MQMGVMLWDVKELILISLPLKVLIDCNMEIFMPWKEIGILCGNGKDLIVFKLLSGLQLMSASLPIFVEASGESAYLQFVLDVGQQMRLPFMCSGIVPMQLRYGSA